MNMKMKRLDPQLELMERLAVLGTVAAGVVHEVNNPLAVMTTNASFVNGLLARLHRDVGASAPAVTAVVEEALEALADIEVAGARITRIIADLRVLSRPTPTSGRASVAAAIDWALRTTGRELRACAQVVVRVATTPDVVGDESRLGQVFINLLVNAAQAIPPGHPAAHRITVTTRVDRDGWVVAEVTDTGTGIAADVRSRIFEPFFTTKPEGVGTGLGLSICQGIVTSMFGELEVDSERGRGTTMRLRMRPAAAPAPSLDHHAATITASRIRLLDPIDVEDTDVHDTIELVDLDPPQPVDDEIELIEPARGDHRARPRI